MKIDIPNEVAYVGLGVIIGYIICKNPNIMIPLLEGTSKINPSAPTEDKKLPPNESNECNSQNCSQEAKSKWQWFTRIFGRRNRQNEKGGD